MKFIDLFAGLGGFTVALSSLGHDCVFACEINESLRSLYRTNFGFWPEGDIRGVPVEDIAEHDILCAGFPCQPFSKAGSQYGFSDIQNGDLFGYILKILETHAPSFVILENVPHLQRHGAGKTWRSLFAALQGFGYDVDARVLSPHQFGVPQIRQRLFIVGSRLDCGLDGFLWPEPNHPQPALSIRSVLDKHPSDARQLSVQVKRCLQVWQCFLDRFPSGEELPSFPIWSMEFGATYPYENCTPYGAGLTNMHAYRGSHGKCLAHLPEEDILSSLPSHARDRGGEFPAWKVQFIRQNRDFYVRHKAWIDEWLPSILEFPSSFQKLEWNCKREKRSLNDFVLQMRPSGVRVKRPTTAPSLVAMTDTQVPIIAWEERYMTPRECARLQCIEKITLPASRSKAFAALGNAVNARLVEMIADQLIGLACRRVEPLPTVG